MLYDSHMWHLLNCIFAKNSYYFQALYVFIRLHLFKNILTSIFPIFCCLLEHSEFIRLYILLDNIPQTVIIFHLFLITKLCNCPIVHLTLKVSMTSLFLMCKHLLLESSSWYHENRDFITLTFAVHRKASLTSVAWFTIDSMWFWDALAFSKHSNDFC